MFSKQSLANMSLLLAAFIWGTAFVAQSVGMDHVGPFTFLWVRSFIGSGALLLVVLIMDGIRKKKGSYSRADRQEKRKLVEGGIICGLTICVASSFQQVGMQYTSVGNAGFITSMYMIIVPLLSIFLGKKVKAKMWLCVMLAAVGMYLLSIKDGFIISEGDVMIAVCALFFALQIMVVDYYAPKVDCVKLSLIQFVVVGIISMIMAFAFEEPDVTDILAAMGPLLYAGILSSGVAFTLQIVAQKYAQPTVATLFMSMESVFSLLGGIVVLGQVPTLREGIGCLLVFVAVVASQISVKGLRSVFIGQRKS